MSKLFVSYLQLKGLEMVVERYFSHCDIEQRPFCWTSQGLTALSVKSFSWYPTLGLHFRIFQKAFFIYSRECDQVPFWQRTFRTSTPQKLQLVHCQLKKCMQGGQGGVPLLFHHQLPALSTTAKFFWPVQALAVQILATAIHVLTCRSTLQPVSWTPGFPKLSSNL